MVIGVSYIAYDRSFSCISCKISLFPDGLHFWSNKFSVLRLQSCCMIPFTSAVTKYLHVLIIHFYILFVFSCKFNIANPSAIFFDNSRFINGSCKFHLQLIFITSGKYIVQDAMVFLYLYLSRFSQRVHQPNKQSLSTAAPKFQNSSVPKRRHRTTSQFPPRIPELPQEKLRRYSLTITSFPELSSAYYEIIPAKAERFNERDSRQFS